MKTMKRTLAFVLALVMVLSLLPGNFASRAEAEETAQTSDTYEPWNHGYRFVDILNWDPATDDYSEELVAKVPLQDRIGAFAATQANPDLLDQARLYTIGSANYRNTDTSNGPWNAGMAYDDFSMNLFKFWQYTDIVGAGGRPTEQIDAETKAFIGSFEYGTIAIPQASTTNAAHKNGVLSLAEYFVPRTPQYTVEWLYQDENGNYPYAQKLIDIMNYYGFDGYFINQEEYIHYDYVPLFRDMLKWMRDRGAYIQWYDSIGDNGYISYQNAFNDYNDGWIWNEEDGRVTDSIFLNYWYTSSALKNSKAHAESLGLDPYDVVYMGVEGGQWKFSKNIDAEFNAVDENGQPYTSFAIWGGDWYQNGYDTANNNRYKPAYQWGVEERERMYFTSASEIAGEYSTGTVTRDDVGAGTINFQGFSKYIVEKSVIDGTVFTSNFNNGHGMQYFLNGEVSRDVEWSNLNIQDVLPTWQWWIESEGEALTLDMDWDYGPEYSRKQGAFPYTQVGAYNGGSSLVVYGDLADTHMVNLYKTELDVTANTELALTYHKSSADDASQIGIAVTFKNGDAVDTVILPIADSGKQTGWTTATVDLGEYAGKVIAAIGVELSATEAVEDYQINLGRLVVSDGNDYTPSAPTGVKLEKMFDSTNELQISWNIADYSTVNNYHIYAVYADGSERFVGGAYAENYYIQTLEDRANVVALEVRAVGIDGSESAGTQVALNGNGITNVKAASANNKLVVTWNGGEAEVELKYFYSDKAAPAAKTGNGTVTFDIDVEDGEEYILTLTNDDGFVNYFGGLADNFCEPYAGQAQMVTAGKFNFNAPVSGDWISMDMTIDGWTKTYNRFGANTNILEDIEIPTTGMITVSIVVTDIYGNVSAPTNLLFLNGIPADMDAAINPEQFPDDALRAALEEKVGTTLQDLADFVGPLDLSDCGITELSGLALMGGVTELDLSGNDIVEIGNDMLPPNLTKLTLEDNDVLEVINIDGMSDLKLVLGDLPSLKELSAVGYGNFELNLSGCTNLENLYLTGAQITELDITALTKLHNFTIDDSQIGSMPCADAAAYTNAYFWNWTGAKLDLSEGTDEGDLMAGMKEYFENAELPDEPGRDEVIIADELYFQGWMERNHTYDLGVEKVISSIKIFTWYPEYYGYMNSGAIDLSADGVNFTRVTTFDYGEAAEFNVPVPVSAPARYVKLVNTYDGGYPYLEITIRGYGVAPKGFSYDSQKPEMVRDEIAALEVPADGTEYDLMELLENWYASTKTAVSGTAASALTDADWIDQAYLAKQATMPASVKVTITDEDGNVYVHPQDTLGNLAEEKLPVEPATVYTGHEYSNEEGYRMFDGSGTSKWCGRENSNWLTFELAEPKVIGQWYTMHAGSEDAGMISSAFRLQVLDTSALSEEDYLALSEADKKSVGRTAAYWKDLSVVTGNTENEVITPVDMDKLTSAQVYRFVVDQAAQPDGNAWGALRVYEMELYAYEGTTEFVANGLFKADTAGEYTVTYLRGSEVLNTTTVTVIGEQIPDETEPEVTEPDVTEPDVTEPDVTEPDVTEPEVTEPEVTEPDVTEPDVTEPDVTEPDVTEPDVTEPEVTEPDVTEPDVTEPDVTEPDVTEPDVTEPKPTEPKPTEPKPTEPKPTKPQGGSADTGDAFSALWIFAMTISLAGAASLLVINKKRRF